MVVNLDPGLPGALDFALKRFSSHGRAKKARFMGWGRLGQVVTGASYAKGQYQEKDENLSVALFV